MLRRLPRGVFSWRRCIRRLRASVSRDSFARGASSTSLYRQYSSSVVKSVVDQSPARKPSAKPCSPWCSMRHNARHRCTVSVTSGPARSPQRSITSPVGNTSCRRPAGNEGTVLSTSRQIKLGPKRASSDETLLDMEEVSNVMTVNRDFSRPDVLARHTDANHNGPFYAEERRDV